MKTIHAVISFHFNTEILLSTNTFQIVLIFLGFEILSQVNPHGGTVRDDYPMWEGNYFEGALKLGWEKNKIEGCQMKEFSEVYSFVSNKILKKVFI